MCAADSYIPAPSINLCNKFGSYTRPESPERMPCREDTFANPAIWMMDPNMNLSRDQDDDVVVVGLSAAPAK